MDTTHYQRKGISSNSFAGSSFEEVVRNFWSKRGINLNSSYPLLIGISYQKKHRFDFGCDIQKILIECKSHRWTEGDNVPSAKMTVWNEAMYYFSLCPSEYRKIFCCLRDYSKKRKITLAEYYIRTYGHLIPQSLEIWEFCEETNTANKVF